jgi:transposase
MLSLRRKQIYLACGHTDMRKSINGLSVIVQSGFQLDPCDCALFVFCNRKRDRLKILEWENNGFWLHLKRLERGHFKWPEVVGDEKTMTLSDEELTHLLGSPGLEQKLRRRQVSEQMVI